MNNLNITLSQLDTELTKRGLCWSVGSTRLCRIECRIWPMDQAQSKIVSRTYPRSSPPPPPPPPPPRENA